MKEGASKSGAEVGSDKGWEEWYRRLGGVGSCSVC